jgi:transglutaminase-like putative cysteine protease
MTRHPSWLCVLGVVVAGSGGGLCAGTADRVVEEIWEEARIEDARVGYVHTLVEEVDAGTAKRLRATATLDLTLRRYGSIVRLRTEQGTEETAEGRVVAVFLRQGQEGSRQLDLRGELEDGRMHVTVDGGRLERRLSWPAGVVGWYGRDHLFQKRRPVAGDHFEFLRYEPIFNTVTTVRVQVRGGEEVALPAGPKRLLRIDMTPDRLEAPGVKVQPPGCTWWLDGEFLPVRRTFDLEGLGTVVLTRTTRQAAITPAAPGAAADIGMKTLIPVDRRIPRPYATRSAVYRITLRDDGEREAVFSDDAHQAVRRLDRDRFEVRVHPPAVPRRQTDAGPPPEDCLAACHYIDCDNEAIRTLATRAVGDESDPWKKARRIERWVKQQLRVDNAAPLVCASATARELRGDCRHYALLTAALCRAAGVPARTAIGLLYVERGGRPQMGFHMWTEVWISGQWLGLDATLGRGGVDAAHIKITDHSWKETQSLTPLLPVQRVLGKLRVEVVAVEEGD